MRPRLAIVGSLALALAIVAPTSAASASTYRATLSGAGLSGTITVSIAGSAGTLTESLSGLAPRTLSELWLRGGSCTSTSFGIVRVRWTASSAGRVNLSATLTPAMVGFFKFDWSHRGGVHATLTNGSKVACARLSAGA